MGDTIMLVFGRLAFWPLDAARGAHWSIRVVAVTCGWAWIIPAVCVLAPLVLLTVVLDAWDELRQ